MGKLSLYAVEDQPLVLEGLSRITERADDLQLVGSSSSWVTAREQISELQPNIVLLNTAIDGYRQCAKYLIELQSIAFRSRPILWVGELTEGEAVRLLQAGARGQLRRSQPVSTLCECIRNVASGELWLEPQIAAFWNQQRSRGGAAFTPREREIVAMVCEGKKNKEVAEALGIAQGTVKVHMMHIFEKTAARDRSELIMLGHALVNWEAQHEQGVLDELTTAKTFSPERE